MYSQRRHERLGLSYRRQSDRLELRHDGRLWRHRVHSRRESGHRELLAFGGAGERAKRSQSRERFSTRARLEVLEVLEEPHDGRAPRKRKLEHLRGRGGDLGRDDLAALDAAGVDGAASRLAAGELEGIVPGDEHRARIA
jgi:hypothetical protein